MPDELNARPYGSSASRMSSGSSRPMPRAAATHCAVRLGASSRIAAGELVRHRARPVADLVVLALDGELAVALADEHHVVADLLVLELVDAAPVGVVAGEPDHAVEGHQVGAAATRRVRSGLFEDRRAVHLERGAVVEPDRRHLRLVAVSWHAVGRQPLDAHRAVAVEAKIHQGVGLAHLARRIPKNLLTRRMRYLHTMIRVRDLPAAIHFFCEGLGLT